MTRDEYIQTEVMQKCWHEWSVFMPGRSIVCNKCGMIASIHKIYNPAFSTHPSDSYELQQFVLRTEWWLYFKGFVFDRMVDLGEYGPEGKGDFTGWLFSDASRFADLVAEFRGWKG